MTRIFLRQIQLMKSKYIELLLVKFYKEMYVGRF